MADCYRLTRPWIYAQAPWKDWFYEDTNLINWGIPMPRIFNFRNIDKFEYWSNFLDYKPFQALSLMSILTILVSSYLAFFWYTTAFKDEYQGDYIYGYGWTEDVHAKIKELKW